jgi:hypothetical protein
MSGDSRGSRVQAIIVVEHKIRAPKVGNNPYWTKPQLFAASIVCKIG